MINRTFRFNLKSILLPSVFCDFLNLESNPDRTKFVRVQCSMSNYDNTDEQTVLQACLSINNIINNNKTSEKHKHACQNGVEHESRLKIENQFLSSFFLGIIVVFSLCFIFKGKFLYIDKSEKGQFRPRDFYIFFAVFGFSSLRPTEGCFFSSGCSQPGEREGTCHPACNEKLLSLSLFVLSHESKNDFVSIYCS